MLSPRWLMSVMRVTMELPTDKRVEGLGMSEDQIQRLKDDAVIECKFLESCWKDCVLATDMDCSDGISRIRLILQAYHLISPFDGDELFTISITDKQGILIEHGISGRWPHNS